MPLARTHNRLYNELIVATSLKLDDTDGSNYLTVDWNEDDSSDRTLSLKVNSGNRTLDLAGDFQITAGFKITVGSPSDGQALVYNATNSDWRPGSAGATTFIALTDTPANFTGSAAKVAVVNSGETALEFTDGLTLPTGLTINVGGTTGEIGLGLYSISSTFSTIAQSDAEGIASSSDLRIGLDESSRNVIICDRGDIATDLGLSAQGHNTLYIFNANADIYGLYGYANIGLYDGYCTFAYSSSEFQIKTRAAEGFTFEQFATDIVAGHLYKFQSSADIELTDTDAEQAWMYLEPKINQSGTANYIGLLMDVTETAAVGTSDRLLDLRIATVSKFSVNTGGAIGTNGVTPPTQAAHIANSAGDDATAVNAILVVLENLGFTATS